MSEQEGSDWERAFRINLFGIMYAMKHQIRRFREQQTPGAIVNTASVAGVSANAGLSPYNSSKWGVLGLTQTAATENAAVWLCSEQASYITGVALPVDGGLVLRR